MKNSKNMGRIYIPYTRPELTQKQKEQQEKAEREQRQIDTELRKVYGPDHDPNGFGTY
jgi:hypothetical protein